MSDPDPDALIGQSIGDYRLEALIGVGGMGHVYRASAGDGSPAALKLVRTEYAQQKTFRRRFQREAEIAQQVKNPHVVPVLAVGEYDGTPYLVQQFISGGTLADMLKREGRLDAATAVPICEQVADGIDALFAAGMIHRDVKPGNVLLDPDGTAYITDFGLAKDLEGSMLTRPGETLGSLDYMSPEQIRGETLTAATDVYCLGCVMYECFTGRAPFAHRPGMRVIMAHIQEEPPAPTEIAEDLSPELSAAIMTALEKEPDFRPQSASEYARKLTAKHPGLVAS